MQIQQTELSNGNARIICWLPRDSRVKIGTVISFEKGGKRYKVENQYTKAEYTEVNRNWSVGGLN